MVDESGRSPDVAPDSGESQQAVAVNGDDVKRVLFGSHKALLDDILITLLSSENNAKWCNYECSKFYDFALSSTAAIYHAMTIHDLNIVINVLRQWECEECPVGIKLNGSELQKLINLVSYWATQT